MNTPSPVSSSYRKVRWLIWSMAGLAVVMGGLALSDVSLRLQRVQVHHDETESARTQVTESIEALREYREKMASDLRLLISQNLRLGERRRSIDDPGEFEQEFVEQCLDRAAASIEFLGGDDGNRLDLLHSNLREMHRSLRDAWTGAQEARATHQRCLEAEKSVRDALATLEATVTKVVGGLHLRIAKRVATLPRNDPEKRVSELEELSKDFRYQLRPSQLQDDLQELALLSERMFAVDDPDELRSLKDNQLRQTLIRLQRNSQRMSDAGGRFRSQLDAYRTVLFGAGAYDDARHQTMVCGADGLYTLKEKLIRQRRRLDNAIDHAEELAGSCRRVEREEKLVAARLCVAAAVDDGNRLHRASRALFMVAGAASVVFLLASRWIVGLVSQAMKESEKSQKESAELARIIRESPYEVYIIDQETLRFVAVNHGACASTGYTSDELRDMGPADLAPNFDFALFEDRRVSLISGKVSQLEFQTEHRRKDGLCYPIQVSLHQAVYQDRPVYVSFVNDLTEVQRLEQQLAQAQKLESIGQLAAGIAHEMNTPMQFVGANLEFVSESLGNLLMVVDAYREFLDDDVPVSWEERREQLRRVMEERKYHYLLEELPSAISDSREGVQRTVSIVRAMKEFSHPGTKSKADANLNDSVESTVTISRHRWKDVGTLEADIEPELPPAPMLVSEINQVLLNLIVNASDAVAERLADDPNGEPGKIVVRTRAEPEHVVLEVQDNGVGIPEESLKKVFDPFYTTKEVGKGTGQGLSICHSVVVGQHGGEIFAESEPGAWTRITVRLPRAPHEAAQHQPEEEDAVLF